MTSDPSLTEFFAGTHAVIEATSFEVMCLWEKNDAKPSQYHMIWKEMPSARLQCLTSPIIGAFYVSLRRARIANRLIVFWNPTSPLIDHQAITAFFKLHLPKSAYPPNRPDNFRHADAGNFMNVFH